jgi:hypothetical protein
LQLRWNLTLNFWYTVATFGSPTWALEDVPWRTTDGMESDYFTLFVAAMVAQRFERERSAEALVRLGRILEELAGRGRIIRRPLENDPALEVHAPGVRLQLVGSEELGERRSWVMSNYSSVLLLRVMRTAAAIPDTFERDRLVDLANRIWRHLLDRRITEGPGKGLWDQPGAALARNRDPHTEPSWYHTERVVECLVAAAETFAQPSRTSIVLADLAREFLNEAEHIFDQERLLGTPNAGHSIRTSFQSISARLDRARVLLTEKPGTSARLAQDVLRELDELATARLNQIVHDRQ